MKKLSMIVGFALIAPCAFAAVIATAGHSMKPVVVDTGVTIEFDRGTSTDPYNPYADAEFNGELIAEKPCRKARTVVIKMEGGGAVGQDQTDVSGAYVAAVDSAFIPGTNYFAAVKQRVVTKGTGGDRKKVKCAKGKSNLIPAS